MWGEVGHKNYIMKMDHPLFKGTFSRGCHRICPVSYTHLDVYKRQTLKNAFEKGFITRDELLRSAERLMNLVMKVNTFHDKIADPITVDILSLIHILGVKDTICPGGWLNTG